MNGIEIKKKKLTDKQKRKLELATYIDGDVPGFSEITGVSEASIRKARKGKELSEQIIDKIIKAL